MNDGDDIPPEKSTCLCAECRLRRLEARVDTLTDFQETHDELIQLIKSLQDQLPREGWEQRALEKFLGRAVVVKVHSVSGPCPICGRMDTHSHPEGEPV